MLRTFNLILMPFAVTWPKGMVVTGKAGRLSPIENLGASGDAVDPAFAEFCL